MLLGHCPKLRLDLLKPLTADRIEANQWKQTNNMMAGQVNIVLRKEILSWSRIFKLVAGVISKRTGSVSFVVQMSDGCERRCHIRINCREEQM